MLGLWFPLGSRETLVKRILSQGKSTIGENGEDKTSWYVVPLGAVTFYDPDIKSLDKW